MKKLLSLLIALLLLPCLAQAESAREQVAALASSAEETLAAMGLDLRETCLNPLVEWPRFIPTEVMENELLPRMDEKHRDVFEDHYVQNPDDPGRYVLRALEPGYSANRRMIEGMAQTEWLAGDLAGIQTARLYASLAGSTSDVEEWVLEPGQRLDAPYLRFDFVIEVYDETSNIRYEIYWAKDVGESGWTTMVCSGNVILRTSYRLTDEMERDVLIRFLRVACPPDPETGLRTLCVAWPAESGIIMAGQYYSIRLNEETGQVEQIVAEYTDQLRNPDCFTHLAALLMGTEEIKLTANVFERNGGYERLYDNVRISLSPVLEGQEGRKLTAQRLDTQEAIEAWMAEAASVVERMGVQLDRMEIDYWNMLTERCPLAMTDERMQTLLANARNKTDSRLITRYYVLKGPGLYSSAAEQEALESMYPALREGNLWLLKRSLRSEYTGLHSDPQAGSRTVRDLAETETMYPPLETDVIWVLRKDNEHQESDLAWALKRSGYTEEHFREDRMLVDATSLVERPYQSVCRFWLREGRRTPCILMVFESPEAALAAHAGYAATPDDCVALLWECYLLVLPQDLPLDLQCEVMQRFLATVQY